MVKILEHGLEYNSYVPEQPKARLLLAHGAGAGNQHEFMTQLSLELASLGLEVISFNFPYMQTMYELESKRPPNSNKQLVAFYQNQVETFGQGNDLPLFISGKSMGGRIATQIMADEVVSDKVQGVIVYGYPFIPPGKPEKFADRIAHFPDISKPLMICQGERDTFGNKLFLSENSSSITNVMKDASQLKMNWIPSGDHSFKPLKASGLTSADNIKTAAMHTVEFIQTQIK